MAVLEVIKVWYNSIRRYQGLGQISKWESHVRANIVSPITLYCAGPYRAGIVFGVNAIRRIATFERIGSMNITLSLAPLVSLIAGILILVIPRLLNYIVAFYLIVIGLIGLFGAGNYHF